MQSKLRTGGCTWVCQVSTLVSTQTPSAEGKQDYQDFRISIPGLPNFHLHNVDDSITTDLKQHFLLESNAVNIKLPLSDTIKGLYF